MGFKRTGKMAIFYAIVLDWDFGANNPTLDLIDSGKTSGQLKGTTDYDPSADCSRILRDKFQIDQQDNHPIRNSYTSNINPAHICRLSAV